MAIKLHIYCILVSSTTFNITLRLNLLKSQHLHMDNLFEVLSFELIQTCLDALECVYRRIMGESENVRCLILLYIRNYSL